MCSINFNCKQEPETVDSVYTYITPEYNHVRLDPTADTINIRLDEYTNTDLKSINIFNQGDSEYLSFHDRRSESVCIFNLQSRDLVKKIVLKNLFSGRQLYKTSAYTKNFDSIFITNKAKIYLFDTAGTKKISISFLSSSTPPFAFFECTNPPVFKDSFLFTGVRPYVKETSLPELRSWRVLYKFDFRNNKTILYYHLPPLYHKNLFGFHFLDYGYCYNDRGNFVFSFAADTSIYETNLTDFHKAYYGKSQYQTTDINPVPKESILNNRSSMEYATRYSYGPIYFDPYNKFYLRQAKQKISKEDYLAKSGKRKQSIIIFNQDLKIIGESELNDDISFNTLFFTANGKIYARINSKDEYSLHFVRLSYTLLDKTENSIKLAKKTNFRLRSKT